MNALTQDKSLLIGSAKDIKTLAQQNSATLLVISDSHGFSTIFSHIIHQRGPHCDAIVFCGDGISDVAACIDRAHEDAFYAPFLPPVISIVEGNGDADRYPIDNPARKEDPSADPYIEIAVPLTQTFTVAGHRVFSAHGHRYSLINGTDALVQAANKQKADIICYGHTHIAMAQELGTQLILNPGSCTRPRGGQRPCFAQVQIVKESDVYSYTFYEVSSDGTFPAYTPEYMPHW